MEKLEEKLWRTLERLTKDQFQSFKWFLKKRVLEGFSGISEAQLEEAERHKTVDLMVQTYQGSGALKVTLEILAKISRNDLVEELEASKGKLTFLSTWSIQKVLQVVLLLFRRPPAR